MLVGGALPGTRAGVRVHVHLGHQGHPGPACPRRSDSHRLLFSISHQAPSLQSFLQQQAQLELLARRVTLLEAIIWPGNGRVGRQGQPLPGRAWEGPGDTDGTSQHWIQTSSHHPLFSPSIRPADGVWHREGSGY